MQPSRRRHRAFAEMTGVVAIAAALGAAPATAESSAAITAPLPFTLTLSNTTPLLFGMDADTTARVLGTELYYVSGRPGDEVLLALRSHGGSGLLPRRDRLYLQFRGGRLTGWKGDWGRNWMWR
jgi:hypothetical protein